MPEDPYPEEFEEGMEDEELELEEPKSWMEKWAPCFLAACVLNFAALYVTKIFQWTAIPQEEQVEVSVSPPEEPPPPPEEELEKDVMEEQLDVDRPVIEDPIFTRDPEVADHNETADDEPFQEAKGDPNNLAQVDFQLRGVADVLGAGGGGGGRYGDQRGGRRNLVRGMGGSRRTESAVRAALDWLKYHQGSNGGWDCDGFMSECGKHRGREGQCAGPGSEGYDVGVTGLALEAFLGHGDTHQEGDYQQTVSRAIDFLKGAQDSQGFYGPQPTQSRYHTVYNHALATYAMAEAYAMTGDSGLRSSVQKAVDWLVAAQNSGLAWRYMNYNGTGMTQHRDGSGINDSSVTGWVIMALKAATHCEGINFPAQQCFDGANAFLDTVMTTEGGEYGPVKFGYYAPNAFVHRQPYVTTAAGMLVRQFTGNPRGVAGSAETLMGHLPRWDQCNMYEWYYATLTIFQVGGEQWQTWNEAMKSALLENQQNGGCLDGSWDPDGTWGGNGGRVYSTATGALCLEVYYRYLRMQEE